MERHDRGVFKKTGTALDASLPATSAFGFSSSAKDKPLAETEQNMPASSHFRNAWIVNWYLLSRSENLRHSPLFKLGGTSLFNIDNEQKEFLSTIYKRMIKEQNADYLYKDELVRNYINLVIHEALKLEPADQFVLHKTASSRITSLFLELPKGLLS